MLVLPVNLDPDLLLQQTQRLLAHQFILAMDVHRAEFGQQNILLQNVVVPLVERIVSGGLSEDRVRKCRLVHSIAVVPGRWYTVRIEIDLVTLRNLVRLKNRRTETVFRDVDGRPFTVGRQLPRASGKGERD